MRFVPLVVAASGMAISQIGRLIAQVAPSNGDFTTAGSWVTATGSAVAVGGLAYIARLMASGKLVARDPARVEAQVLELVEKSDKREAAAEIREQRFYELLTRGDR